ncbi:MAG: hypothetical protein QOJ07_14 [Thermoleophilaceae bacterium]|nr:hypothetical protein [Thermoleophilaceae bacterium]
MRGGRAGAALSLAAGVSYALDFSGRSQWSRVLFPRAEGANVVARVHPRSKRERTVVLVAHIDTARTGLVWHPRVTGAWAARAARTGRAPSPAGLPLAGFALGALPGRPARAAASAVAALGLALALECGIRPPVPGANDNACAAAGLVALVRRFAAEPLEHTELIAVGSGCEETGMGGFAAWLRTRIGELRPESTLVVGLAPAGGGEPMVLSGEGPRGLASYDAGALAWADRGAAAAGLPRPPRFHGAIGTDPVRALFAGLPAISIVGVEDGGFPNYHRPTDTPERVDWSSVERSLRLVEATALAYDAAG